MIALFNPLCVTNFSIKNIIFYSLRVYCFFYYPNSFWRPPKVLCWKILSYLVHRRVCQKSNKEFATPHISKCVAVSFPHLILSEMFYKWHVHLRSNFFNVESIFGNLNKYILLVDYMFLCQERRCIIKWVSCQAFKTAWWLNVKLDMNFI